MDLLTQAINDFAQWRSTRATREQTPLYLKKQIATLVHSYSKSELCQALNINNRLIERCVKMYEPVNFVELPTHNDQQVGELHMKLNTQSISVSLSGLPQDMAAMIRCLGVE